MDWCNKDYRGFRLLQGYLKKQKSKRKQWTARVNLRYFVLDLTNGVLHYRRRLESAKVLKSHKITDILAFGGETGKANSDWSYPLWVLTKQRHYRLFAATKTVQEMWLEALSALQLPLPPFYYSTLQTTKGVISSGEDQAGEVMI